MDPVIVITARVGHGTISLTRMRVGDRSGNWSSWRCAKRFIPVGVQKCVRNRAPWLDNVISQLLSMKSRRSGSVLALTKSRCKKKLHTTSWRWGRRLLFAAFIVIVFHLGAALYSNTWKSETYYNSEEQVTADEVHRGRKLLSEGVVWEQCHFEKGHSPYAFLPLYAFLIFLLFVGENVNLLIRLF